MTSDELRNSFLKFFEDKGHKVIPSSPLIPQGDPTLLLTSAGMVQFKPYFTGEATPPAPRLASCQKCFRTTDMERVGNDKHLTFFEMLGNFSIGDYFKKEAIAWGWEYVTQHLKIPKERLWVTVFLTDDESHGYWKALHVPLDRIVRLGEKDNFWGPAGESGPCGPSSEIHYDFGAGKGCGHPECNPGCSCGRFLEIWNLVFTEFYQDAQGKRTPLPRKNIDTGMGLERALTLIQGKTSFYETDVFAPILEKVSSISGKKYGQDEKTDRAMRIVAEHGRSVTFLIADGVVPSNEGRGYVLRRVLRRAAFFAESLAPNKPFLGEVAKEVVAKMGHVYPELVENRSHVLAVIGSEVEKFREALQVGSGILQHTLIQMRQELADGFGAFEEAFKGALAANNFTDLGYDAKKALDHFLMHRAFQHELRVSGRDVLREDLKTVRDNLAGIRQAIDTYDRDARGSLKQDLEELFESLRASIKSTSSQVSGIDVFSLYDTWGFPPDLTAEIASESGLKADLEGFEAEMARQREKARASHKFLLGEKAEALSYASRSLPATEFVGYDRMSCRARALSLGTDGRFEQSIHEGQDVEVVLDKTPFYAEMGGQVADTGELVGKQGTITVTDVHKLEGLMVHLGKVSRGTVRLGEQLTASVDRGRRLDIARNHSATHLLHAALRQVLGSHVRQMGSLVAPDRFRFDFSFQAPVLKEELARIQQIVNDAIRQNLPVTKKEMTHQQAVATGAMALFGEKYGDVVRVVRVGSPKSTFSLEVCGGTHLSATGEIGFFQVLTEGSIGSGLRRIEAVTGRGAEQFIEERLIMLERLSRQLETTPAEVEGKLTALLAELDAERKRGQALERQLSQSTVESLLSRAESVNGVHVLAAQVEASNVDALRHMGDIAKDRLGSAVIVLGAVWDDRPNFLAMVTPDLVARGLNASDIIKKVAGVTGGGGGGRPTLGQGGGKDKGKVSEALKTVARIVQEKVQVAHTGS